ARLQQRYRFKVKLFLGLKAFILLAQHLGGKILSQSGLPPFIEVESDEVLRFIERVDAVLPSGLVAGKNGRQHPVRELGNGRGQLNRRRNQMAIDARRYLPGQLAHQVDIGKVFDLVESGVDDVTD